jgi:hypothetical protein
MHICHLRRIARTQAAAPILSLILSAAAVDTTPAYDTSVTVKNNNSRNPWETAYLDVLGTLGSALVVSLKKHWARIVMRVAGSWVAAVGLLMSGWAMR